MSLSFDTAVEDIREAAMKHQLPGPEKKLLWATIVSQFAESPSCDGALVDLLEKIIQDYVEKLADEDVIAIWLETEAGGGDDPETLYADSVRMDLEVELLEEVTRVACDEAKPPSKRY